MALFCETKPYIYTYRLKKVPAPGSIQLFEGNNCRLAVSGAGAVSAMTASVYMLTRYAAQCNDTFVNIGAAGSTAFNTGEIVLCNKTVNTFTGKTLYPELLYKHPFREGVLGTVGKIAAESDYDLIDMEGAFVYEAAQMFLPSSQIHCIKVISDNLRPESVTPVSLEKLMSETAGAICSWLDSISEPDKPVKILTAEEDQLIDLISSHLRLTFAMIQQLRQACRMAKVRGSNIIPQLSAYSEFITQEKREGKALFAELMEILSDDKI